MKNRDIIEVFNKDQNYRMLINQCDRSKESMEVCLKANLLEIPTNETQDEFKLRMFNELEKEKQRLIKEYESWLDTEIKDPELFRKLYG